MNAREYGLPEAVRCPFCEGAETELHSPFGTALSVATYWCRRCRTAFEWVKWGPPAAERHGGDGGHGDSVHHGGPESTENGGKGISEDEKPAQPRTSR